MKIRASAAPMFAPPPSSAHSGFERLMLRLMGLPTYEEAERRLRSRPGYIASLTPEQIAAIDAYDGPEVFGSREQVHQY